MKKILFAVVLAVCFSGKAFAVTDVNETAGKVVYGSASISTHTYTDISSNTMTNVFAWQVCNEGAIGAENVRCGYDVNVSTIAGNVNLGFWVKPQECEYRAVSQNHMYCKAVGTNAISISREIFGKPQY